MKEQTIDFITAHSGLFKGLLNSQALRAFVGMGHWKQRIAARGKCQGDFIPLSGGVACHAGVVSAFKCVNYHIIPIRIRNRINNSACFASCAIPALQFVRHNYSDFHN
ncbi:MAG: hypothetical protein LBI31_02780 [Zoogloeaceae bacterium]|nr:hypothetical protein [Zoogloeaceae bacterium]